MVNPFDAVHARDADQGHPTAERALLDYGQHRAAALEKAGDYGSETRCRQFHDAQFIEYDRRGIIYVREVALGKTEKSVFIEAMGRDVRRRRNDSMGDHIGLAGPRAGKQRGLSDFAFHSPGVKTGRVDPPKFSHSAPHHRAFADTSGPCKNDSHAVLNIYRLEPPNNEKSRFSRGRRDASAAAFPGQRSAEQYGEIGQRHGRSGGPVPQQGGGQSHQNSEKAEQA